MKLIAGNWKMNGRRRESGREVRTLLRRIKQRGRLACEVAICPPSVLLPLVGELVKGTKVRIGAQDCHALADGAHTGDQSAAMLADAGCAYVIVGHSERRADHGESSRQVRAKAEAAHGAGLAAIVCVGETRAERRRGQTLAVVGRQLGQSVPMGANAANTVVAYEPVWAIGTGLTPTSEDVAQVHRMIRARLRRRFGADGGGMRLLYGGSVNGANAAELLAIANVDGALVGGASLTAKAFWPIVRAAG